MPLPLLPNGMPKWKLSVKLLGVLAVLFGILVIVFLRNFDLPAISISFGGDEPASEEVLPGQVLGVSTIDEAGQPVENYFPAARIDTSTPNPFK